MAEIRVQPQKKSRTWLWLLLLLLVLAAVGYYLYSQGHLGGRAEPAPAVQPGPTAPATPGTPGTSSMSIAPGARVAMGASIHHSTIGGRHGTA